MLSNAVLFLLGPYTMLCALSGFFLFRSCRRFVEVKASRWATALLFVTMTLTSSLVVWIGDNNFAMALPFYLTAFFFATKGDWLGQLTVGGIFFCFIMSVCAMTDSYLIPLRHPQLYDFLSRAIRPVVFGGFGLLVSRHAGAGPVRLPHRLWKLCAGLTLLPFVTLAVLILPTYWMPDSVSTNNLTLFQGVFILPLSLLVSVMLLHSILVLADYEQKAQAAALAGLRDVYYQSLQAEQQQVRALRHDLRNHLNAVLGLLERQETEKAQAYLAELTASSALQHSQRLCDNEIVNVVLASKCGEMARRGIRADLAVALPAQLPLADTDLCALLGNALDNAIEAAQKASDKTITLRCRAERGMFMLLVQNPLAGDERPDLRTTKKEKSLHGFGLVVMREITARYGGVMEAGPRGSLFELLLTIPLS